MISHAPAEADVDGTALAEIDRCAQARLLSREDLLALPSGNPLAGQRLASSPLATATAISALVLAEQHGSTIEGLAAPDPATAADRVYQGELSELIVDALHWLAQCQRADGGWGDVVTAPSSVSTTLLVCAAFHLTGVPARYGGLLERAEALLDSRGGVAAFKRRHRRQKTMTATILSHCALADMIPWRMVPALPYERACLPRTLRRWLPIGESNSDNPAFLAVGLVRFVQAPPANPLVRTLRAGLRANVLGMIDGLQSPGGSFLEATPLTSFVVMSLASAGYAEHAVVRRGVEYLLASVDGNATWPLCLRDA